MTHSARSRSEKLARSSKLISRAARYAGATLAVTVGFVAFESRAHGAALTWDTSTAAGVQPGTGGTWDVVGTNLVWTTTGTTLLAWTQTNATTPTNTATFAGADGTYTINLATGIAASAVTVNNSGYTLSATSAQTLSVNATGQIFTVATGKTFNVGNNVNINFNVSNNTGTRYGLGNGAVLNINAGATLSKTSGTGLGGFGFRPATAGDSSTINVNGTISWIGANALAGSGSLTFCESVAGTVNVNVNNGGVINTSTGGQQNVKGAITVGDAGTCVFTMASGSTVTISSPINSSYLCIGGTTNAGVGTVNLDGGTLTVPQISKKGTGTASGTLNFNGGQLVANLGTYNSATNAFIGAATGTGGAGTSALDRANVRNGGAKISSGGFDVTISQALLHSNIGGDAATDGGLTKSGTGVLTLTGTNTFTGPTSVTAGTLALGGAGAINTTNGITVNGSGARLLQTSSVAVSPAIGITQGTLDGTTTVGTVNIADLPANTITNGNLTGTGILTTGALNFAGDATITVRSATGGTVGVAASTITTTPANGTITVNASTAATWLNGANNLVSYSSLSGAIGDFTLGTVSGLVGRQTSGGLILNGNNIALQVNGDSPVWTGLGTGTWTTATTGDNTPPNNWALKNAHTATNFWAADTVEFNDTYNLGGGPVAVTVPTVDISAANVSPSTTVVNNSTVNYTIMSSGGFGIATGTLAKSGTASLTISTANSYTGGTTFNGGTLKVNNNTALGNGSLTIATGSAKVLDSTTAGITLSNNNTQNWNDDFTFTGTNSLDMGTGNVTIGGANGTRSVAVTANTLQSGKLLDGGTHGLSITGSGTLAFTSTGLNTSGSLINGSLSVGSGATLQINRTGNTGANSGDFTAGGLSGTGTINNGAGDERWLFINNATANTYSGTLTNGGTGALGFNKLGAGSMTLDGTLSYTGATTLQAGTLTINAANTGAGTGVNISGVASLVLGNTAALGTASLVNFNAINGTTITYATDGSDNLYKFKGGTGAVITFVSDRATAGSGTNHTFTTEGDGVSGFGGGTYNFTSGGNNTGGSMTINLLGFSAGSVQNYTLNPTSASLTIVDARKTLNNPNGTIVLDGTSTGNQVTGVISNGTTGAVISVTKSNTSTWTLSGASTYTGATSQTGGTLNLTGSLTGTAISITGGTFSQSAAGAINGGSSFTSSATSTLAGTNNYTGATLISGGTTTLTGSLGNTNVTIGTGQGAGTLQVNSTNASPLGPNALNFDATGNGSTARLEVLGGTTIPNAITLPARNNASVAIENISGNNTLSGLISLGIGGTNYTIQSDAGTISLTNTGTSTIGTGKTLFLQGAGDGQLDAAIAGAGGVTKDGTGLWKLTGASTYGGPTSVIAGTLLVNGSTASSTTVTGGTLGGTGSLTGTVSLSGGNLSPGASIESLSTGALTMNSGTTFIYEADPTNANLADLLAANGALSLTGVNLDLSGANLAGVWTAGTKLTLISYNGAPITSGFTGYTDDTYYTFGGNAWLINYDDTTAGSNFTSEATQFGTSFVTLTVAVPEPTTTSLVALGAVGLIGTRRRRRTV